jgi:hypothetical protein
MSEVLKELASVFRVECANSGGPMQASLQRMADMLDAKAAELAKPVDAKVFVQGYALTTDEPRVDGDTAIVSISDELEIED